MTRASAHCRVVIFLVGLAALSVSGVVAADELPRRGTLGVRVAAVPDDVRVREQLARREGVLVEALTPSAPAEREGVAPGDVVVAVDGRAVDGVFPPDDDRALAIRATHRAHDRPQRTAPHPVGDAGGTAARPRRHLRCALPPRRQPRRAHPYDRDEAARIREVSGHLPHQGRRPRVVRPISTSPRSSTGIAKRCARFHATSSWIRTTSSSSDIAWAGSSPLSSPPSFP